MANSATKVQFLTTKRDGFYAEARLTDGKKRKKNTYPSHIITMSTVGIRIPDNGCQIFQLLNVYCV